MLALSDVVDVQDEENIILALFRNTPAGLSSGERIMYSRDSSGVVKASVKLTAAGDVVLNEGTEKAVKGDSFESQYNPHTHPGAFGPTGPVTTPLTPAAFNPSVKL